MGLSRGDTGGSDGPKDGGGRDGGGSDGGGGDSRSPGPPSACVACSDEPSEYMKSEQTSCAAYVHKNGALARTKCSGHWLPDGLCQRSCYEAGWGSVRCCGDHGAV